MGMFNTTLMAMFAVVVGLCVYKSTGNLTGAIIGTSLRTADNVIGGVRGN